MILGPDGDLDTAFLVAEEMDRSHPSVAVILFATPTARVLERAMHNGIRGVLAPDAPQAELSSVIEKAMTVARRMRDLEGTANGGEPHRIIVVVSPKGGAGKTTVSSNLSAALALDHPGEVALVDLDLQFGDAATVFGIEPLATIADLARSGRTLTSTHIKTVLTPDIDGKLFLLAAPASPAEADDLQSDQMADTVRILSREFRWVVIDTPAGMDEFTLGVLDLATDIMLVTSMDIPSVRAAHKEIELLNVLGLTNATRHLILNRANSKVGLSVEEIESTIGQRVDIHIPSTRRIPLSINNARPLVLTEPKSPASRAISELAARVVPAPVSTGNWLSRRKAV